MASASFSCASASAVRSVAQRKFASARRATTDFGSISTALLNAFSASSRRFPGVQSTAAELA